MSDVLDLTELIAARALTPRKATFAGIDMEIRRDLTAMEVVEFYGLLRQSRFVDGLAMLISAEPAAAVAAKIEVLPREHQSTIYNRIMREAGALPRLGVVDEPDDQRAGDQEEPLGESSAS